MYHMRETFNTKEVHIVGGSLLEHATNDIDIAIGVESGWNSSLTMREMTAQYKQGVFDSIVCHQAYVDDPKVDPYHTIFVTEYCNLKVDFLFYYTEHHTLNSILGMFPLSIQMKAMNVNGFTIYGPHYADSYITVYIPGKSEKKYRGYYPNKEFIYATDIKSRQGITGVQEEARRVSMSPM